MSTLKDMLIARNLKIMGKFYYKTLNKGTEDEKWLL